MKRHPRRPPDVPELIDLLNTHQVHFVIVGSVAAQLYGVKLKPGDFDITPKLDPGNLQRLAQLLLDIEATPESFGHWEVQSDGEKRWVEEQITPEILATWQPDLDDPASLDHLYLTHHGNFDVVPELAGDYTTLMESAVPKQTYGYQVWVANVDELLARLTVPRREKDISRVKMLREIQRTKHSKQIEVT